MTLGTEEDNAQSVSQMVTGGGGVVKKGEEV